MSDENFDEVNDDSIIGKDFLDECEDFFNLVDKLLICQLSQEDENAICQVDLEVADSNMVTTEQFDFLDLMAKKYKLGEAGRGVNA